MSTTTQTDQLAAQFETLNGEVIELVQGCSDEQWRQTTAAEGWSVAVTAHHIGEVHGVFIRLVERLTKGETFSPAASIDDVHRANAQHARDFAEVGKQETLEVLRTNGDALGQQLRSLNDAQLGRVVGVFGGHELTVEQVVQNIVVGHPQGHLASIRATLAG
jgi:uncharacterized damage-inducible protein DinB